MATPLTCLYTTVQCLTPQPRTFAFLGRHGKRLAPYQQYTVPGDLATTLASRGRAVHFKSFEKAVAHGDLAIVKTPAVHLYDDAKDVTKVLTLDNGALGKADACWGGFSSSMQVPGNL